MKVSVDSCVASATRPNSTCNIAFDTITDHASVYTYKLNCICGGNESCVRIARLNHASRGTKSCGTKRAA